MNIVASTALGLLLCAGAAARPAAEPDSWAHTGGKVGGSILNLACQPLAGARITLRNKRRTQVITPDRRGGFIVELPAGVYTVTAAVAGRSEVAPEALTVLRDGNGGMILLVDTGVEVMHGCFGPSPEDLLIPVGHGIISDRIWERPLLPHPLPKP